jgi:acetylornithine deacetylase/succinyl-diaminopimelate desuccinylase-like protein
MSTGANEILRSRVQPWTAARQSAIVSEFVDLLSIPNVTSDRANINRNAAFLKTMLEHRGFRAELLHTERNPLVWGERALEAATRTVLVYCHYDGQPVDPKSWAQDDPFVPVLRSGRLDRGGFDIGEPRAQSQYDDDWRLYARSAATSKGPIIAFMAALDALRMQGLEPTVSLRVVMDGEEELSSPSLDAALDRYRDKLTADLMLVFAGPIHFTNQPTIVSRVIAT